MNLTPEDPRITAFALGEIDPLEAKQIEAAVGASAELREAVESIRSAGSALEQAFAAEAGPEMSDVDKAALYPGRDSVPSGGSIGRRRILFWPLLAGMAALVMVGFILVPTFAPVWESARHTRVTVEEQQVREETRKRWGEQELTADGEALFKNRFSSTESVPASGGEVDRDVMDVVVPSRESIALREPSARAQAMPRPKPASPPPPQTYVVDSRLGAGGYGYDDEVAQTAFPVQTSERMRNLQEEAGGSWQRPHLYVNRLSPQDLRARSKPWNTDAYDPIAETGFRSPLIAPVSTFSIDVDTASYSQVRGFLMAGRLPPPSAVRIEEFLNYFSYQDAPPAKAPADGGDPFAVHVEQAVAPWAEEHRLLRVSLKGYDVPWEERPASNLVFLIDVSGSMNQPNRLPLAQEALQLLVERLDERDRVAIVVYAGAAGVALPSTSANNTETLRHAIGQLKAGGSTNGNDGIQTAYATARKHLIEGGNNRVILCTDGDFNVGITDRELLGEYVQKQADEGVSLTVLGFGMGNYKDNMLETLSEKGKGTYGYIDTPAEGRKFFLHQLAGNLFSIARDVKIQVEFNPSEVKAYRLIGYENRTLKTEDFNDDAKRAGDIGPGHGVIAFYEIVPAGVEIDLPGADELRYQGEAAPPSGGADGELATVKLRYKRPAEEASRLIVEHIASGEPAPLEAASEDFRFGAAVAAFGLRLSGSETVQGFEWEAIRKLAQGALGQDPGGHRAEFSGLVERAEKLDVE